MKKNEKNIAERIKKAIISSGGYDEIAKKTGIPKSTLANYTSGRNDPKVSLLIKIAEACDTTVLEFMYGDNVPTLENSGRSYISIPVMNVEASAGHGAIVPEHEEVQDMMRLNESWLRTTFHANPNSVTILPIKGDSMEPTIRSGELALIEKLDPSDQPGDGIYVIRVEEAIAVKRLQFFPNKHIKVSSDNPLFSPYEVTPDNINDFAILGRVLVILRAL